MATAVPAVPGYAQGNLLQGTGATLSPSATIGVQAASPKTTTPTNTIAPAQQAASLSATQKAQLDIASSRIAAGNGSPTDVSNVNYAKKTYGYTYSAPAAPTPAAPSSPAPQSSTSQNQVLNVASMSQYQPNQYQRLPTGEVVLNPGVTPVNGTTKPYTPATTSTGSTGLLGSAPPGITAQSPVGSMTNPYTPTNTNLGTAAAGAANAAATPNAGYSTAESGLNALGTNPSPEVAKANDALTALKNAYATQFGNIMNDPNASLETKQGRAQILQDQYATQLSAANTAVSNALAQQSQQITAFGSAAGAGNTQQQTQTQGLLGVAGAVSPTQVPYSNQFLNPITGQPVGSGTTGLLNTPSSASWQQGLNATQIQQISTLANEVANGTTGIDYTTAYNQLSQFGPIAQNALLQAVKSINPNFNLNVSSAQATAQTQNVTKAGQVGAAIQAVNPVLENPSNPTDTSTLKGAFAALPGYLKTGSSALTDVGNWFSNTTTMNLPETQNYLRILSDVRAGVDTIIQTGRGLGVDMGAATANSLFPNNMNEASLNTAISQVKSIEDKIQTALATPSNAGSPINVTAGSPNTGGLYNW